MKEMGILVILNFIAEDGSPSEYHFPTYNHYRAFCRTEDAKTIKWVSVKGRYAR